MMLRGARGCTIVDQALSLLSSGDPFGDLGPIDCPVRILYGTADRVLVWPRHYRKMHRLLPRADWVPLVGLGHLPMWDDPVTVAEAILAVTAVRLDESPEA
jgi:pimeloyl-ACP methyl ester carboxylesterase